MRAAVLRGATSCFQGSPLFEPSSKQAGDLVCVSCIAKITQSINFETDVKHKRTIYTDVTGDDIPQPLCAGFVREPLLDLRRNAG